MRLPRLSSRKTVTAEDINDIVDKIDRMFRGLAGAGLTFRETPAGVVLSASHPTGAMGVIIQDTEPLPQNWPQGWLWIDDDSSLGSYRKVVWLKTDASTVNNFSRMMLPAIWLESGAPPSSLFCQGDIWVDTDSGLYDTHYRQAWLKTDNNVANNNSIVPLAILVTS